MGVCQCCAGELENVGLPLSKTLNKFTSTMKAAVFVMWIVASSTEDKSGVVIFIFILKF
jgi:hypothetical protein